MKTISTVLCILLLGATAASAAGRADGAISGRITDASGAAVRGSSVTLSGGPGDREHRTTTDGSGEFRFEALPPGEYRLSVEGNGFSPASRELAVVAGETHAVEIALDAASLSEQVTVTATREPAPLSTIPSSVSVLDAKDIAEQAGISREVTSILAKTVPGFGVSREQEPSFGQSLRGRDFLILIDGIPQNFDLRIGAQDELSRVDPSLVERIEVIRGASSVYGSAAAGGIVNIITKKPDQETHTITTDIGTTFSAIQPGGSFAKRFGQRASGPLGRADYFVGFFYEDTDSDFDADGERIPHLAIGSQTDQFDVNGKLGYDISESQRLQFSFGFHHSKLERSYGGTGAIYGVKTADAIELPLGYTDPSDHPDVPLFAPYKRELSFALTYDDDDVFGSALSASFFHMDYDRREGYASDFFGGQLLPEYYKTGARALVDTPLEGLLRTKAKVVWGADYQHYFHDEPLSNGLTLTPPIVQDSFALFAQFTVPIKSAAVLRGGVRRDEFRVDIDDFRTHPSFGGVAVRGGNLDYGATTYNVGAVFFAGEHVELFSSFSQGYSITEIGRLLFNTELPSVAEAKPEAQKVDNYEFGARANFDRTELSISGFYSTSDLGTTFSINPVGIPTVIRSAERIGGVEATADVRLRDDVSAGGTFSYQKGVHDEDLDGEFIPLPNFRIAPVKLTAYVDYSPRRWWRNRLQALYSGTRDEFPGSFDYGAGRVGDVFLLDLYSAFDIGRGTLSVGIENLLNRFYVPQPNQGFNIDYGYYAGRGMTVSLNYSFRW